MNTADTARDNQTPKAKSEEVAGGVSVQGSGSDHRARTVRQISVSPVSLIADARERIAAPTVLGASNRGEKGLDRPPVKNSNNDSCSMS